MANPAHHDEGRRLRKIATAPGVLISYTDHALERMAERGISRLDVRHVLKTGFVARVEMNKGEETWNVRGTDLDERDLEIVIVAYDEVIRIKVISAWERR